MLLIFIRIFPLIHFTNEYNLCKFISVPNTTFNSKVTLDGYNTFIQIKMNCLETIKIPIESLYFISKKI